MRRNSVSNTILKFEARQRLSQALMNAIGECKVVVGLTVNVELVRLRKGGRIPVRGTDEAMTPSPARMIRPLISTSSIATRGAL